MAPDQVAKDEDGETSVLYTVKKKSFPDLIDHVRAWRRLASKLASQSSYANFNFKLGPLSADGTARLYALGRLGDSSEHSLLYVDIPPVNRPGNEGTSAAGALSKNECKLLCWKALQESGQVFNHKTELTKEEIVLRERMRCMINGIVSYDFHPDSCSFLFSASSRLYTCDNFVEDQPVVIQPVDQPPNVKSPMDAKICPINAQLISFVSNNDLYLQIDSYCVRATFTQVLGKSLTAGVSSFVVQEEFDRYTGYWWCPVEKDDNKYYILYEENDESPVLQLIISGPAVRSELVDIMRYPRAGTPNTTGCLKMLQITIENGSTIGGRTLKEIDVKDLKCCEDFRELFPWAEYITRAGWFSDGTGVWVQLMSRVQNRLAIVFVPLTSFRPTDATVELISSVDSRVVVLYEEHSDIWINWNDCLTFLKSPVKNQSKFIWCHSKTGYNHLYTVESSLEINTSAGIENVHLDLDQDINKTLDISTVNPPNVLSEVALTSGEWEVCRKAAPFLDEKRQLLYFVGLKDSPLEAHVYCVRLDRPRELVRLTELGYYHGNSREVNPYEFSPDGRLFATMRSNISEVGKCVVYALNFGENNVPSNNPLSVGSLYPTAHVAYVLGKEEITSELSPSETLLPAGWDAPELYTYCSTKTGFTHYAYLFKPADHKPRICYPTVLYVYGGPEIQLVKNVWMGHVGMQKYTSLGYAVVMVDGRGSSNRGVSFERKLHLQLGTFEIDDQVEVLTYISKQCGFLDLNRVAIIGWSYGGYLALMGLAQRPDIFKVAISGAPVTHWQLYDTAYTERYLGTPQSNGDAYSKGSVLTYVDNFPAEPGRLMLLHGIVDENVHFQHTSMLINALIKARRPYQLQIFPNDRHAVKNVDAAEHLDANILHFLQTNL